jgi:zinc transport system substrate-binding protein
MKKFISLMTATAMVAGVITGCGADASTQDTQETASVEEALEQGAAESTEETSADATEVSDTNDDGKLSIVTTIFPEYDWVKTIVGDNAEKVDITMLLDNGVDLHSYQPTAEDIMKIATCDMFVYVGGESDEWVEDALAEATNENMVVIDLLDVLGENVKEEEIVEGMEAEEEHEEAEEAEESDAEEHEHEEGEVEYDEHVWLSLKNTKVLCTELEAQLETIDPDNAETYKANLDSYVAELDALDAQYQETVDAASVKTLLFGDRFPFRYLVDDYGLDYYAAFVGCSAETEASFETIIFLADKVNELGLNAVMTIEGNDHTIAETVRDNTESKDQEILTLDSMQSTTSEDVANGASYLSIMTDNLEVLKSALQ